jgi:hypothetical protein
VSTFTIGGTVTTFTAVIRGSSQDSAEPETLTITAYWSTDDEWHDATNLMTQTYHVHKPLGGNAVVIDVARGGGAGTLVLTNVGTTTAIMVGLRAQEYLPGVAGARVGTITFIRTAAWS